MRVFVASRVAFSMSDVKRDRKTDDRIGAELAAHADSLSRRMLDVTVPVYLEHPKGDPELVGSAVLVTLANDRFLFSAAHVLEWRRKGQLVAGASPDHAGIRGTLWPFRAPGAKTAKADYIDLAIVQLRGDPWDSMALERFCSWDEIDHNAPIMARHSFGVIGFPVSKNKRPVKGDRIKSYALPVAGLECDEATYRATGRNPVTNVMIGYDARTMSGAEGMRTAPALNGVSGGGVWRFGRKLRAATRPPLLSAIGIEWHQDKHKYILGTRISVALAALADTLPQVRGFLSDRVSASSSRTPASETK